MKELPAPEPEKKKPAVKPAAVWSPSMKTPPMPMGNSDLRDANGERRPDRSYSESETYGDIGRPPRYDWDPDSDRYSQPRNYASPFNTYFDITKGRMQTYPKHPNECFHTRQVAHAANVTKFICEDCGKTMSDER